MIIKNKSHYFFKCTLICLLITNLYSHSRVAFSRPGMFIRTPSSLIQKSNSYFIGLSTEVINTNKNISQNSLAKIIEARMTEIFHLCKSEINKSNHNEHFTFGVVLTGGGAKLNFILDLAQEIFEMTIKIGIPDSVNGNPDILNDPRYSTSIGIIKYALENKDNINNSINNYSESGDGILTLIIEKLKKITKLIKLK